MPERLARTRPPSLRLRPARSGRVSLHLRGGWNRGCCKSLPWRRPERLPGLRSRPAFCDESRIPGLPCPPCVSFEELCCFPKPKRLGGVSLAIAAKLGLLRQPGRHAVAIASATYGEDARYRFSRSAQFARTVPALSAMILTIAASCRLPCRARRRMQRVSPAVPLRLTGCERWMPP